jgi:hypothetical protein
MPRIKGLARDGPYGGQGGSAYNALHNEQKVKHVEAWSADYKGYNVLGALELSFEDGTSTGRIGGRDPNIDYDPVEPFDFQDGETITRMHVYAGDGEGFCNGFDFETNWGREFTVGSKIGKPNQVPDLGRNGEWAGASGRDDVHGADAVVDNMILYFKN